MGGVELKHDNAATFGLPSRFILGLLILFTTPLRSLQKAQALKLMWSDSSSLALAFCAARPMDLQDLVGRLPGLRREKPRATSTREKI